MSQKITRRCFLAATAASSLAGGILAGEPKKSGGESRPAPSAVRTLDLHVHLFGIGDAGTGCRLSRVVQEGPVFQYMAARWDLRGRAKTVDEAYLAALVEQVKGSGLDMIVLLAQDAVYDAQGRPDWENTHFYVPNDYVLKVAREHSQSMVPCVSVNPARRDALEELDRCADGGARVLKIHPPTQRVNVADPKYTEFFRRCAARKVLVMIHTGHEHAVPVADIRLADPGKLALALDQGCTVVACHCGTGWPGDKPDLVPAFLQMLQKHKNLWGDSSILGAPQHAADTLRLIDSPGVLERLLHGSDFPFESGPLAFAKRIGLGEAARLQAVSNVLARDFGLKQALGIGRPNAERAWRLICGAA